MEIKYSMEIARKSLGFIDDQELQTVIAKRLDELERVFSVNANLSTIILSISSIEGIFRHVASIFKKELKTSPKYPKTESGKKKNINQLKIEDIYKLLLERDILQHIKNFDQIYTLFRNYRNFIHPQAQQKKSWPVDLGQAQMAIGLLNATIDQISKYIFIGTEIFETVTGTPRFDSSKVLHLDRSEPRTESFLISKRKIDSTLSLSFDVELGKNAILNFVFNYLNDNSFKMLRLDNRNLNRAPNSLLYCNQKDYWNIVAEADQKRPPDGPINLKIKIDFEKKLFLFTVNGDDYKFFNKKNKEAVLFKELKNGLRVGWFNEQDTVKIFNLRIS